MSNYITDTLDVLRDELAERGANLPDGEAGEILLRLYGQLVLTTGEDTSLEDVHDAWAMWRAFSDRPDHPSIVWLAELDAETIEYDRPYAEAIRAAAKVMDPVRFAAVDLYGMPVT